MERFLMAHGKSRFLLAMLLAAIGAAPAAAQTVATVMTSSQQQVYMAPLDDQALFIDQTISTTRTFKADIGFDYLRPSFSRRSTSLRVPAPGGGSVLGGTDDVGNDFAFVPSLKAEYEFGELGFGVSASAKLLSLDGKLNRNVQSNAGAGNLIVNSSLGIAAANLVEAVIPFDLANRPCLGQTFLGDFAFVGTVGARFAHLRQHYDATLTVSDGVVSNNGKLIANQIYNGFGLTSSLTSLYPLTERTALYSNVRGSILIGNNQRDSSLQVLAANTIVQEDKTQFMPTGEVEVGIAYGMPVPHRGPPQAVAPLLWFKAGFVGQVWGNVGLLNVNDTMGGQFNDSHLYLYGFTVQVGLDY